MIVLVVTAAPTGLRGELTRWLLEIDSGVYVGNVSARIRNQLWERTTQSIRDGRALLVYTAQNEQRLTFETHNHHWFPVDVEGLTLMKRPSADRDGSSQRRTGWSNARSARRSLRPAWRRQEDS